MPKWLAGGWLKATFVYDWENVCIKEWMGVEWVVKLTLPNHPEALSVCVCARTWVHVCVMDVAQRQEGGGQRGCSKGYLQCPALTRDNLSWRHWNSSPYVNLWRHFEQIRVSFSSLRHAVLRRHPAPLQRWAGDPRGRLCSPHAGPSTPQQAEPFRRCIAAPVPSLVEALYKPKPVTITLPVHSFSHTPESGLLPGYLIGKFFFLFSSFMDFHGHVSNRFTLFSGFQCLSCMAFFSMCYVIPSFWLGVCQDVH